MSACSPALSRAVRSTLYDDLMATSGFGDAATDDYEAGGAGGRRRKEFGAQDGRGSYEQAMNALVVGENLKTCPIWPANKDLTLKQERDKAHYGTVESSLSNLHRKMYGDAEGAGPGGEAARGSRLVGSGWICQLCGKKFKSLFWLDYHHVSKHKLGGGENDGGDAVCMADLCPVVGCKDRGHMAAYDAPEGLPGEVLDVVGMDKPSGSRSLCDHEKMDKNREDCGKLLKSCFGESLTSERLAEATQHFCGFVSCSRKIHSLAGKSMVSRHGVRKLWESHDVYTIPFWRGKVLMSLLALFYAAVALGGFWGVRGKGLYRIDRIKKKKQS